MTSLNDQIQQDIEKERERSEKSEPSKRRGAGEAGDRLAEIRPRLDELSHTTHEYSLKVGYAIGPYAAEIAVVELYDLNEVWVATWQVAETVGGSVADWEVTYNPHGVQTQHEWFRNSDALFKYLTASIAERVVEMQATEK